MSTHETAQSPPSDELVPRTSASTTGQPESTPTASSSLDFRSHPHALTQQGRDFQASSLTTSSPETRAHPDAIPLQLRNQQVSSSTTSSRESQICHDAVPLQVPNSQASPQKELQGHNRTETRGRDESMFSRHSTRSYTSRSAERSELDKLRADVKHLREENRYYSGRKFELKEQVARMSDENRRMRDDAAEANKQIQALRAELHHARRREADLKTQLEHSLALAETRRVELKGSESFLTKADTLAESDLMKMVNELNDEIFQVAAALTEEELDRRSPTKEDFQEAYDWVFNTLGKPLADALHFDFGSDNDFVLQSGLQCCMAHFAQHLSCTWRADRHALDKYFTALYRRIHDQEAQPVAGRWRALTRANIYTTKTHADAMQKLNSMMTDGLLRIMIVAGYRLNLSRDVLSKHQKRFDLIIRSIFNLNTAMGVQFTSADFELINMPHGRTFDPREMEDVDEPSTTKRVGFTICTTALGLGQVKGQPTPRKTLLVKPKVVIDALLQELGQSDEDNDSRNRGQESQSLFRRAKNLLG